MKIAEARPIYLNWKSEPDCSPTEFRKLHSIQRGTFADLEAEYKLAQQHPNVQEEIRDIAERNYEEGVLETYDSVAYLKSRTAVTDKALVETALRGNASAQKLIKQLLGELIEKQEIKVGLTADEIARRNLEAERRLREGGYTVENVP